MSEVVILVWSTICNGERQLVFGGKYRLEICKKQ